VARRVLRTLVCVSIGLAFLLGAEWLGERVAGTAGKLIALLLLLILSVAWAIYGFVLAADRARAWYWRRLDPSAGPPAGAAPAESDGRGPAKARALILSNTGGLRDGVATAENLAATCVR